MSATRRVGICEAKTNLVRLVDEIHPGEVARQLREMRRGKTLGDISVTELIETGRL